MTSPPAAQDRATTADLGLLGLVLLAQFHGVAADPAQLAHQFTAGSQPFSETDLLLAAKSLSLKASIVKQLSPAFAGNAGLLRSTADG